MTLKQILTITFCMAATLLVSSCSQEKYPDVTGDGEARPLCISVTDVGYVSDGTGKNDTRVVENGYTTEFTAGDACGLYIMRTGKNVAYENVKLIATAGKDGTLTWQPEKGVTLIGGYTGETYFLYYPYQSDMNGKFFVEGTSSDASFFSPLISGWQVAADQSTYAKYTACDLMTAKGSATKNADDGKLRLTFSMTHRMALTVIDVPKTVYRFTNSDVSISDYVVTHADFTDSDVKPYRRGTDGRYHFLTSASSKATTIIGSIYSVEDKKEFAVFANMTAGCYKRYVVEEAPGVEKAHLLQPGDYYLADGHLLSKDATLTDEEKNKVIGIVFYAGHHKTDISDYYYQTGIALKECHGYVIALKDASSKYGDWGIAHVDVRGCGAWSAYAQTHKNISECVGGMEILKTKAASYRALYYAVVSYEGACTAPYNSSGWFLTSAQQFMEIIRKKEIVSASFSSLGTSLGSFPSGYYWPSDTFDKTSGNLNPSYRVNMKNGTLEYSGSETYTCKIRSALAF